MAYGLEIRDTNGNLLLDTSNSILTILGVFSQNISETLFSGSFSNAAFGNGTPFFFIIQPAVDDTYNGTLKCRVSFSGTTCNWSVDESPWLSGRAGTLIFYYGYY